MRQQTCDKPNHKQKTFFLEGVFFVLNTGGWRENLIEIIISSLNMVVGRFGKGRYGNSSGNFSKSAWIIGNVAEISCSAFIYIDVVPIRVRAYDLAYD